MSLSRALHAVGASWRASLLASTQYRGNFLLSTLFSALWTAWSVLPLIVVFDHVESIKAWSPAEATLVMAWFVLLRGLLEAVVQPNLTTLVERVRSGTLDFVLLKPADPQLLVSFSSLEPARLLDVPVGLGLVVWALDQMAYSPSMVDVVTAAALTLSGAAIIYALWLCAAATSFWWVKVDSLTYLLGAVMDAGRWPGSVYRGAARVLFTFVFPVIVMTSAPPRALLGRLDGEHILGCFALALMFSVGARLFWRRAVASYTSASS